MDNRRLPLLLLISGVLTTFVITRNDPFFGDSVSSITRAAETIFSSKFQHIRFPEGMDPGHPTTMALIHSTFWAILGKSIWVSHFLHWLISIGVLVQFIRLAKHENIPNANWGAFLLLITPLYLSQSVNPNLHMGLTLGVLSVLLNLRKANFTRASVWTGVMMITHLQALFLVIPLWLWWMFTDRGKSTKDRFTVVLKSALIPALMFVGLLVYHYSITGWWMSSPDYAGHRGIPGSKRIVINLIVSDWRIVDYGQLSLFILPFLLLFRRRLKLTTNHPFTWFLVLYLFNAIAISVNTKTGPMHRYFLPVLPLLIMGNLQWISQASKWLRIVVVLILVSGHFWFYPGKVMGDATLSYRSVFPLLHEVQTDVDTSVHTYAPLNNSSYTTLLNGPTDDFQSLYGDNIENVSHVIYSNISGDFTTSELKVLETWPVKTYQRGYVFVELYSNPAKVSDPPTGPRRKISNYELWFIKLKRKLKGDST